MIVETKPMDYLSIPDELLRSTSIPSSAKLLQAIFKQQEVSTGETICTLTAAELAELIGVERATILRLVKLLEKEGYLKLYQGRTATNKFQYFYEIIE